MNQVAVLSVTSHILYGTLLLDRKYILLIAWTFLAETLAHSFSFFPWFSFIRNQMMHFCFYSAVSQIAVLSLQSAL